MSCKDKHDKHDCDCKDYKDHDKSSSDYADEYDWMKYPCHKPMHPMPMMKPMVVYHYHYMMKPMMHQHKMEPIMHHHEMEMDMGMEKPEQPELPQPVCPCRTWYQVKPGDSMYKIAQMFNVPLDQLIRCNPWITNPAVIYPGEYICIPYAPQTGCQCKAYYTVKSGDSMYKIAQMYNVPLDLLIKCNPQIPNPALIYPGQIICIPAVPMSDIVAGVEQPGMPQPGMPQPEMTMGAMGQNCEWYTVKSGDSMYKIAQKYNVTLDALIAANPQIPNPALIYPGQKICIPKDDGDMPTPKCKEYYIVKSGDSMYKIAQKYNVSLDALVAANPQIPNPALIYPGQKICIPA